MGRVDREIVGFEKKVAGLMLPVRVKGTLRE